MRQRVNILHISDLHFTKRQAYDQEMVLSAFFDDLKKISSGSLRPDLVIFTGDLVNDADEPEIYDQVFDKVLFPLITALEIDNDNFFMVPGNHDAQRSVVRRQTAVQDSLIGQLINRNNLNSFYLKNAETKFIKNRFKNYYDLLDVMRSKYLVTADGFSECYYIRQFDIGIVSINTAWLTRGGLDQVIDRERLLVPEATLKTAIDKLPDAKTRLLIGHHPTTWLASYCESDFRKFVGREFSLYLHGHMHDAIPQNIRSPSGENFFSQSGALFTDRNRYNGYSVISLNPRSGHIEVNLRSYFEKRNEFDAATDIIKNGRYYSSDIAEQFWAALPKEINFDVLIAWLTSEVLPALTRTFDEGLSAKPVSEVFVPPPITKRSELSDEDDEIIGTADENVLLPDILRSTDNFIIFGKQEFGKTTLLQQIALESIRFGEKGTRSVPYFVNFAEIKPGRDRFLRLLRTQIPECVANGFTFGDILANGYGLILIDDFDFTDRKRCKVIQEFIRKYPKNRYIFTCDSQIYESLGAVATFEAVVPFTNLFVKPFTRQKMRSLVQKWDADDRFDQNAVLDRMVSDIVYLNVPLTAVNGTILLTIFDAQSDFTPINRATLIERFVETLLEKHSVEEAKRSHFDFRNKTHYLSYIASYMVENDNYAIGDEEFCTASRKYFKKLGLNQIPEDHLERFIAAKILTKIDGVIRFKYRAFLEYFIALHMGENRKFKEFVLSDKNYLSFCNEIEYFAGIRRNDENLLDLIGRRFAKLSRDLEAEIAWERDLNRLDDIKVPASEESEKYFRAIEDQICAPRLTDEERDELLEAELPKDVGDRQEVYRPFYENVAQKWTWCLILYSTILKNSELVKDQKKRKHLAEVLLGWGHFLCHSLLVIPALTKHRKLTINGVSYHVIMPKGMSDGEVARTLYLLMPRSISEVIHWTLGTEKLESQLGAGEKMKGKEPLIIKFFRYWLYADLHLPSFPAILKRLGKDILKSAYISEAYLWKLRQFMVRASLTDKQDKEIRGLIASMVGRLAPGSRDQRLGKAKEERARLERSKIIEKLRIQASKKSGDDLEI